uniref:(northern house mosquito) hypothetical protein n=1 Tax=Culex pipiens TaxID=7175 RepID=A0A8D8KJN9_CULPI
MFDIAEPRSCSETSAASCTQTGNGSRKMASISSSCCLNFSMSPSGTTSIAGTTSVWLDYLKALQEVTCEEPAVLKMAQLVHFLYENDRRNRKRTFVIVGMNE